MTEYYDLFEEDRHEGSPIWIWIKRYQRHDAMMKYLQLREIDTFIVKTTNLLVPSGIVGGFDALFYSSTDTETLGQKYMPTLPVYQRGDLSGWGKERREKLADGWTAPAGKDALLWGVAAVIDDMERQILALREQLRVANGDTVVLVRGKVQNEFTF